jgi:hypothetical protein
VGEWRAGGERKYYLSHLPADTQLRALAAVVKARRVSEEAAPATQARTRSRTLRGALFWNGLHRHGLISCIAFASLRHLRLAAYRRTRRRENGGPDAKLATLPSLPTVRRAILDRLFRHLVKLIRCAQCRRRFLPLHPKCPGNVRHITTIRCKRLKLYLS